jgi:hypothetical protein
VKFFFASFTRFARNGKSEEPKSGILPPPAVEGGGSRKGAAPAAQAMNVFEPPN